MKRKDLWVIVLILLVAAVLLFATPQGRTLVGATLSGLSPTPEPTAVPTPMPTPEPSPTPEAMETAAPDAAPTPRPTLVPAQSYVRISTPVRAYAPIPLIEEGSLKLTQGEGIENVIKIGVNRVSMLSSTCDNQDCVQQGEITLENRDTRILSNWVICLPHQVTIELLTPEEAQTAFEDMLG